MEALEEQVFSLLLKHQEGTEYYDQFLYLESCDKKLTFQQVLHVITIFLLKGKKFKKFFKFAFNIRKLCFHTYSKGKLNADWIGCLPFLTEIEEMFRSVGCKFSNNFNFSNFQIDNEQKLASNLEAVLFCKRLNLFIVEFDGSDEGQNIEKLKQLYLTQISLQYVNNSSTCSIILDGKKAIVHVGEFIESFTLYNFACIDHFYTYDLENMMDVIDLSFEIWKYSENKVGNPLVQCDYENEHKQDINKESNANKIQKERKENVLTSKVIENLKRLKL